MILEEYSTGDPMNLEDFTFGSPQYLDIVAVNPNPIKGDPGPKGDQGVPGDPGAITPEFIDKISDELSEDLEPPIDLLILFENAIY